MEDKPWNLKLSKVKQLYMICFKLTDYLYSLRNSSLIDCSCLYRARIHAVGLKSTWAKAVVFLPRTVIQAVVITPITRTINFTNITTTKNICLAKHIKSCPLTILKRLHSHGPDLKLKSHNTLFFLRYVTFYNRCNCKQVNKDIYVFLVQIFKTK